jgi:hypothetical protein
VSGRIDRAGRPAPRRSSQGTVSAYRRQVRAVLVVERRGRRGLLRRELVDAFLPAGGGRGAPAEARAPRRRRSFSEDGVDGRGDRAVVADAVVRAAALPARRRPPSRAGAAAARHLGVRDARPSVPVHVDRRAGGRRERPVAARRRRMGALLPAGGIGSRGRRTTRRRGAVGRRRPATAVVVMIERGRHLSSLRLPQAARAGPRRRRAVSLPAGKRPRRERL